MTTGYDPKGHAERLVRVEDFAGSRTPIVLVAGWAVAMDAPAERVPEIAAALRARFADELARAVAAGMDRAAEECDRLAAGAYNDLASAMEQAAVDSRSSPHQQTGCRSCGRSRRTGGAASTRGSRRQRSSIGTLPLTVRLRAVCGAARAEGFDEIGLPVEYVEALLNIITDARAIPHDSTCYASKDPAPNALCTCDTGGLIGTLDAFDEMRVE